ncbi:hypothetical protein COLO4_22966 [Corchorus olitorius]|uniref:Protein kinase domain-containing protein n=1 Tax=Corchorus olitorius TaxID=93759 RepID=A0A1R3IIU9_9ROSI|nr:hypothetical protein COLO4_22966 [Corchorus olitorius]
MKAAKQNTGTAVAIKKLRRRGTQGDEDEEFKNELRFLSTLNHPNVVKLMGYCYERDQRILIYEYMSKGSLDNHLLNAMRVTLQDFNPKLADFGVARFGPLDDQSHITTRLFGTRGYFAPEYFTRVKKYSDGTATDLPLWAKPHLSNETEIHNIIDKKISRNMEMEEAHKFASIIRKCLSLEPKDRPTIAEVLAELELLQQNMLLSNLNSLGLSKFFRSRRAHI